jgi:hypothetical protein
MKLKTVFIILRDYRRAQTNRSRMKFRRFVTGVTQNRILLPRTGKAGTSDSSYLSFQGQRFS